MSETPLIIWAEYTDTEVSACLEYVEAAINRARALGWPLKLNAVSHAPDLPGVFEHERLTGETPECPLWSVIAVYEYIGTKEPTKDEIKEMFAAVAQDTEYLQELLGEDQ